VNDSRPDIIAEQIAALPSVVGGGTVACLGLSYKADIDDLRESPSIHVIAALRKRIDNPILIAEPHVSALPAALAGLKDVQLVAFEEALSRADAVVLLTDHKAFAVHDPDMLQGKDVIDTRGGWIR
ncbi:MAG: UDP binding domain-containing protein, partial [Rhodospirillales bacterium]